MSSAIEWVLRRGRRRRGAIAPFLPTDIAGAVLWLRADMGVTLNGTDVSAWADQSGNGNNVAQGTASAQPLYDAENADLNNRPSITYANADTSHALVFGGAKSVFNRLHNGTDCTTFHVIDVDAADAGAFFSTLRSLNSRIGFDLGVGTSGALLWQIGNGSGTSFVVNLSGGGAPAMGVGQHVIITRTDATGYSLRLNGTEVAADSYLDTPTTSDSLGSLTVGNLTLGGDPPSIGYAEGGVWSSRLSDAQCEQLESYATERYGL